MVDSIPKNTLKQVILRLDFASPLENIQEKLPVQFATNIRRILPICEIHKVSEGSVQFEIKLNKPDSSKTHSIGQQYNQWRYFGQDKQKLLEIDKKHITLLYFNYTNFSEFHEDYLSILTILRESTKEVKFSRMGLRYINEMNLNEVNSKYWSRYLNSDLLSIFKIYPDYSKISRAFHVLNLNFGDFKINFQYGMPNPDFPAPIKQNIFILDLDAYTEGLIEDIDSIEKLMESFRKEIKALFQSSVKKS
jgi:uncharacterized protein (TIGR04255 family)